MHRVINLPRSKNLRQVGFIRQVDVLTHTKENMMKMALTKRSQE